MSKHTKTVTSTYGHTIRGNFQLKSVSFVINNWVIFTFINISILFRFAWDVVHSSISAHIWRTRRNRTNNESFSCNEIFTTTRSGWVSKILFEMGFFDNKIKIWHLCVHTPRSQYWHNSVFISPPNGMASLYLRMHKIFEKRERQRVVIGSGSSGRCERKPLSALLVRWIFRAQRPLCSPRAHGCKMIAMAT